MNVDWSAGETAFYEELLSRRPAFATVASTHVPANTGHGFRVDAGQAFRFVMTEGVQIVDACMFNATNVEEHYDASTQFRVEGSFITRLTRIWGNPPLSRALATVLVDTVRWTDSPRGFRDHKCYGGHCNPHHWAMYSAGRVRTCYDNLRAAVEMLGLNQRHIHDNMNLFERMAMDPYTGRHLHAQSDAQRDDYLEFYAEVPLLVAVSLCPMGDGSIPPDLVTPETWQSHDPPVRPIQIQVLDTGQPPIDRSGSYGDASVPDEPGVRSRVARARQR